MTVPELPPWRVETHALLGSTQDELKERLRAGEPVSGLVIRAERQAAGRGRRRRDWLSGKGGSWQSAAFSCPLRPAATLFIGIRVTDALRSLPGGAPLRLKWPNDILLQGRKVAGILCEYSGGHLLTGVGVNVANEVPSGAARLPETDLEAVHDAVLRGIREGVGMMFGQPEALQAEFDRLDAQRGQLLTFGELRGHADGVSPDGRLRLLTPAGLTLVAGVPPGQAP